MSTDNPIFDDADDLGPLPDDQLDGLLREWHQMNAERAAASRDRLMHNIPQNRVEPAAADHVQVDAEAGHRPATTVATTRPFIRRLIMNRYAPIAASLVLLAALIPTLLPTATKPTYARENLMMVPEGGRLDALDREGNVLGPCALKHTDVDVDVSGHFSRVSIKQQYRNTYDRKIEAVYTFPMSHRAAVDRMKMTIGDRVVMGEVHERAKARAIYQAAREQGYVASLLEQERPNIFTQSLANIEPGAEIEIEISYVELLESKDGTYSFDFPMVVGPRYIPGSPRTPAGNLPAGLDARQGLTLLAPAKLTLKEQGAMNTLGELQTGKLQALLNAAVPINRPDAGWWTAGSSTSGEGKNTEPKSPATKPAPSDNPQSAVRNPQSPAQPTLWYRFEAEYCNGAREAGTLHTDGTGQLNGRWFYADHNTIKGMGTGFSQDTTQVPDASRITPEPVRPGKRAGHDISIRVTLDTGGPGIVDLKSALHDIVRTQETKRDDGAARKLTVELKKEVEIPNRDFVLSWRQTADTIQEATFTHTGKIGNFFTLILQPPARVEDAQAVPRELVFVLDTSGSMSGFPVDKAKDVMAKAIDALRPQDTFNLITFSGDTHILWEKPRPFTQTNRKEAQDFLASRQGSGGTEMMKAINAALVQTVDGKPKPLTPDEMSNLPADGRTVTVAVRANQIKINDSTGKDQPWGFIQVREGLRIPIINPISLPQISSDRIMHHTGEWLTVNGERVFRIQTSSIEQDPGSKPMRICCFMTDGYVGNDMAIIDAVRKNAGTTRVFSFGIGNSINRFLLDNMARAGRGEVEYVLLNDGADEKVKCFSQRIQTPVLTDIQLQFSDDLKVADLCGTGVSPVREGSQAAEMARLPDLFDVKPLILHGRYTAPGKGTLTIRGRTGSGAFERTLPLDLPASQPRHDTIATLWARAKVEELMNQDLAAAQQNNLPPERRGEVVRLGETFGIMTQFTSFVAVEKARVTLGGTPQLVAVPIEMPQGVSYEGVFGGRGEAEKVAGAVNMLFDLPAVSSSARPASPSRRAFYSQNYNQAKDASKSVAGIGRNPPRAGQPANARGIVKSDQTAQNLNEHGRSGSNVTNYTLDISKLQQPNANVALVPGGAPSGQTRDKSRFGSVGFTPWQPAQNLNEQNRSGSNVVQWSMSVNGLVNDELDFSHGGAVLGDAAFAVPFYDTDGDGVSDFANTGWDQASYGYQLFGVTGGGAGSDNDFFFVPPSPGVTEGLNVSRDELRALSEAMTKVAEEKLAAKGVYDSLATGDSFQLSPQMMQKIQQDPEITNLQQQKFASQQYLAHLQNRVGDDHREVVATKARIEALDKQYETFRRQKEREVHNDELNSAHTAFLNKTGQELALRERARGIEARQRDPSSEGKIFAYPEENEWRVITDRWKSASTSATQPAATTQPETAWIDEAAAWLSNLGANDNAKAWARRVLLRERLALDIAALVKDKELADARKLADALVKFDAGFKIGVQMRDALADVKLAAAERDKRIVALAAQAREPIDAAVRDARLRHRLDQRLYALAKGSTTQPAPADVKLTDRGVRVTVLTRGVEAATLAALKDKGLAVETTAESLKLVVGFAPRERLADIAMLDGVRRIEPTVISE